jgi:hypothetical protein
MASAQAQLTSQIRQTSQTPQTSQKPLYELIDAATLAERLHVTERFVKEATRVARNRDPIPALRIHRRSLLYEWGSPELDAWLERRKQKPIYERPGSVNYGRNR